MRSRRWSEATTSLGYLTVVCVQVPVRKIPERLPTAWGYLIIILTPPVCVYVTLH